MQRLLRSTAAVSSSRRAAAVVASGSLPTHRSLHLSPRCLAATADNQKSSTSRASATAAAAPQPPHTTTAIAAGPYRRVGHIFIVTCIDHPFKFSWEVNRMLRDLRLEFMGQTTIVPDIPQTRKALWRVRHIVRVDHLDLDEAKALIGVPEHMTFRDLAAQIPTTFGRGPARSSPHLRSKANFMQLRRMRLRDVMHRDQLEKRLLEEKRRALQQSPQQACAAGKA